MAKKKVSAKDKKSAKGFTKNPSMRGTGALNRQLSGVGKA